MHPHSNFYFYLKSRQITMNNEIKMRDKNDLSFHMECVHIAIQFFELSMNMYKIFNGKYFETSKNELRFLFLSIGK